MKTLDNRSTANYLHLLQTAIIQQN